MINDINNVFVIFTGEETEKEFLEKCLEQWTLTTGKSISDLMKLIQLGSVFSEIRHRLEDMNDE